MHLKIPAPLPDANGFRRLRDARNFARLGPVKPIAFFDLDGTLLAVNSGRLWMRRERRLGRISRFQVVEAGFYLAAYRFGLVNIERAMRKALQTVKGLPEETVRRWTEEWFAEEVVPHVAPGARAAVEEHRREGHVLAILSSSSPYEAGAAARLFGMDEILSTRYEVRDGRFTGEVVPPVCYGEGKVHYAERLAERRGVDLKTCYYYGDSITDLPILLRVGNPRVVNPDPRLRREARRRGLPVLDWGRAPAQDTP